ncbi:hypothetical protein [Flavobacterium sp. T12S277]|uniref:hypothetical protein n=1 Tax=Flavobacterium sp. T12S277 TaxID=3402752 RepID=UPI003AEC21EE
MNRKTIIYVLLVIVAYYFFSVFFTKNGQFIQYSFSYSLSKKESIEKEIFITDKLDILFLKDSTDLVKKNFDIWLDKSITTKRYGLLPIKFSSENNRFNSININFKSGVSDTIRNAFFYKIHNEPYRQYEMTSVDVKKGTKIKVGFYFNKKLISKIEIVIPRE